MELVGVAILCLLAADLGLWLSSGYLKENRKDEAVFYGMLGIILLGFTVYYLTLMALQLASEL